MFRAEIGKHRSGGPRYCVRWDGTETLVDAVGKITERHLVELIAALKAALADRRSHKKTGRP